MEAGLSLSVDKRSRQYNQATLVAVVEARLRPMIDEPQTMLRVPLPLLLMLFHAAASSLHLPLCLMRVCAECVPVVI